MKPKFITKHGRRIPLRRTALTDTRFSQNQYKGKTIGSLVEDQARKRLITRQKVVENRREWGFKLGVLGNGLEYKRGKTETITKEKK